MPPKTLVFDLDGTLIDSAPDLTTALNKLLHDYSLTSLSLNQVRRMIGDGASKLVERAFEAKNATLPQNLDRLVEKFIAHYQAALVVNTVLYPHVAQTLTTLKQVGHKLAVCTNKPYRPTVQILKHFKLMHLMDGVAGGDSFSFKKPDGRHIAKLLENMNCLLENTIMIGDSQNDVYAARDIGIPVIFMNYGYTQVPAEVLKPNIILDDFSLIPSIIPDF